MCAVAQILTLICHIIRKKAMEAEVFLSFFFSYFFVITIENIMA